MTSLAGATGYRGGVQTPGTSTNDRVDLAFGTAGSFLVNLGYLLVVHGDQRMLLMLFASALVGMGLLLSATKGAVGMGIIIGSGLAIAAALALVAWNGPILSGS